MKTRLNLRAKILIPTMTLLVLGMGASTVVTYVRSKKAMETAYEGQIKQIAQKAVRSIDAWIKDSELDIRGWGEEKGYRSALEYSSLGLAAQKSTNDRLAKLKNDYGYYEMIGVANTTGQIVASSEAEIPKEMDMAKKTVFKAALQGYTVVSNAMISEITRKPVFTIATAVLKGGDVLGVLFGVIDVQRFNDMFIGQVKVGETGDAFMFMEDGLVISHSDVSNILKLNMKEFDYGREMIEKGSGLIRYTYKGSQKVAAFAKSEKMGWILVVSADEREVLEPVQAVGYFNLLITLMVTVAMMFGLGFLLHILSIKPISRVSDGLKNISEGEGDLTARVEVDTEDETGDLARWFNVFVDKIHLIIKELVETITTLSVSSENLSALSAQMASTAEEMSSESDSVAGTAEQMSATINSMASAAEEMSVNVHGVSSTAEEMSQNMHAVASAIEEMSTTINEVSTSTQEGYGIARKAMEMSDSATDTMNSLGKAAKEIGEVTDLIKRIAEQTNLLALNATIEAASAGDAGKGFAVVANEIKELANQSAQAAENIAKRIGGVQGNTEAAMKVIGDISDIINRINDSSIVISKSVAQQTRTVKEISRSIQQAHGGASNISSSIAEVARGANDVAQSAAEAAKGVNEVSANIQMVNKAAGDSSAGVQRVKASADELAQMAAQIQEMVGRFKVESG